MALPENTAGRGSLPVSKTAPPALYHTFQRPRLLEILKKNEDKKLVLFIAQAAQGKTTSAAEYFHSSTIPSSWINLEEEDSDPVTLYALLVQVLIGESGRSKRDRLLSLSSRAIGPR